MNYRAPGLAVVAAFAVMCLGACAGLERQDGSGLPGLSPWPYPVLETLDHFPPDLDPEVSLRGEWVQSLSDRGVLAEATYPEYFFLLPWLDGRRSLFSLGSGSKIEAIAMSEDNNSLYLVARATRGLYGEGEVMARALLRVDSSNWSIVFTAPLSRNAQVYGLILDQFKPEAYVLLQGAAGATVLKVSTFDGHELARQEVDDVPVTVGRRGLALDSDRKYLYVLYGGYEPTSDFMPVDSLSARTPGGVQVMDTRSMEVVSRIQLSANASPVAVQYHQLEAKACVLAHTGPESTLFTIHGAFHNVTDVTKLPEQATDLLVTDDRVLAVTPRGLYETDFFTGYAVRRMTLPFDITGEMALGDRGRVAAIRFATFTGPSGIALVDLRRNELVEYWK